MTYRGIILNKNQASLFKRAKERTAIKVAEKKEEQPFYDFFVSTTIKQFQECLNFTLKEQLQGNFIKRQHIPIGGFISKGIFEKIMEEEYNGKGEVKLKKRDDKLKIFKVYSFGNKSKVVINSPKRNKKGKIFINNHEWIASYVRYYFEFLKFFFNVENGLIEMEYKLKIESFVNNKWIETI